MVLKKHKDQAKKMIRYTEVSEFLTGKKFNVRSDITKKTETQQKADNLVDLVAEWVEENE